MVPIVKTLPSYIKDSQHALQIFWDFNFLGQDKLIFTLDITSLYTVIPNGEGLLALKHFFDQHTVKEPKSETLLRIAELVLTLNCFSFGDNFFKQTNGIAMGTKMGPSNANLFVGFVEHQFFSQYNGPTVRISFQTNDQPGTFKYACARRKTCPFIHNANTNKISERQRSIKITDHFTCTSAKSSIA